MTCTKAIIKSDPSGIDVRVGFDEDNATDEEKALAIELCFVLSEYIKLKGSKGGAK